MNDRDFEVGGRKFKLCKMDAFKQFHVVRRIGPVLSELLPVLKDGGKFAGLDKLSESEKLDQLGKVIGPFIAGFSKLSDQDADFVLLGLLGCAEMQQSTGNWIRVSTGDRLMVQDMDLPTMLQIAGRAFMFNLSGFFSGLPQR